MSSSTTESRQQQTMSFVWRTVRGASSATPPVRVRESLQPNEVGRRFGSWVVQSTELRETRAKVDCLCDCGRRVWVTIESLLNGTSTRCKGCATTARHVRDGELLHATPLVAALARRAQAMKSRCTQPQNPRWELYGGRGIEFRFSSVKECVEHLLTLPGCSLELEVDRRENAGHYEAGNLRFATRVEQQANRRNTALVQTEAGAVPLVDWPSPYSPGRTYVYAVKLNMTAEAIIQQAQAAVVEKRKNWRGLRDRLAVLGYTT